MIESGIYERNFTPGTERYTRPEEIQALRKFLTKVREVQEEHTELETDNLGTPGRVPETEELDSTRIGLKGVEDVPLVDSAVELKGPGDVELIDSAVSLEGPADIELETRFDPLSGTAV
ncbi:MAG: hypothetical protein HUJ56_01715, partial [Erysipelotrichaceae bacterium]|nr:hypothetical protein [Erysipelotrichaceae bacterium]